MAYQERRFTDHPLHPLIGIFQGGGHPWLAKNLFTSARSARKSSCKKSEKSNNRSPARPPLDLSMLAAAFLPMLAARLSAQISETREVSVTLRGVSLEVVLHSPTAELLTLVMKREVLFTRDAVVRTHGQRDRS